MSNKIGYAILLCYYFKTIFTLDKFDFQLKLHDHIKNYLFIVNI